MIIISVSVKDEKVSSLFKKEEVTMQEAAVVLLKLKQIEQEIIDMEFEDDLAVDLDDVAPELDDDGDDL